MYLCIAIYWRQNIKIHQLKNQVAKALADRTQMANYLTNLSHHLRTPINGMLDFPRYCRHFGPMREFVLYLHQTHSNRSYFMSHLNTIILNDVSSNRILPGLLLRPLGHQVHEFEDFSKVLDLLKIDASPYTHLLSDISMPMMSGTDFCASLKKIRLMITFE